MENKKIKTKIPINQVIVSKNDKFLIGRRFSKSIAIVSPFENKGRGFFSNFRTPYNRCKRIQILFEMIPKLSQYSVNEKGIIFDCVSAIARNTDIFNNKIKNGYIHFDITTSNENNDNNPTIVYEINPRLIFSELKDQDDVEIILNNINYKFKTNRFKVFTIILEKGFILCTVDQNSTKLYLTINNPKENFCGTCVKKEMNNISNNISPLWPILNIDKDNDKLDIKVIEDVVEQYKNVTTPVLLKLERQLEYPESVISCIGYTPN